MEKPSRASLEVVSDAFKYDNFPSLRTTLTGVRKAPILSTGRLFLLGSETIFLRVALLPARCPKKWTIVVIRIGVHNCERKTHVYAS